MAVQIAEIRSHQRDDALAFARQHQAEVDPSRLRLSLSVIARDEKDIVGTVLCMDHGREGCELGVCVADTGDTDLGRHLVDKALMKLQSTGAHRCRISTPGGSCWLGVNWLAEAGDRPQMCSAPEAAASEQTQSA